MAETPGKLLIVTFLEQVATAIAKGHHDLAESSDSRLGALVVKEADVHLEFELTSVQTKTGGSMLMIPSPLFYLGASSETKASTSVNRGKIDLKIVNVPNTAPPDRSIKKQSRPPVDYGRLLGARLDALEKDLKEKPVAGHGLSAAQLKVLQDMIELLRNRLGEYKPSNPEAKKTAGTMTREISAIEKRFAANDQTGAVAAFRDLAVRHEAFLQDELKFR